MPPGDAAVVDGVGVCRFC